MRVYVTVGFNVDSETEIPIIQTDIENALYSIDCWVCDAQISPEDGGDENEDNYFENY